MTVLEVAHVDAGLALLAGAGLTVYDGKLPDSVTVLARPYVLVYSTVEWEFDNPNVSLLQESSSCVTTWYCHIAAENNRAAMAVAGRVRAALLDASPTIIGRTVGLIRMVSLTPGSQDNNTGVTVIDPLAIYELETRPA